MKKEMCFWSVELYISANWSGTEEMGSLLCFFEFPKLSIYLSRLSEEFHLKHQQ